MMLDRRQVVAGLAGLAELYGAQLGEAALELYWQAVRRLEPQAWESAVVEASRRCRFMPKPVELLELAGAGTEGEQATRAWLATLAAVRRHGRYGGADLGPRTNAAIRAAGGWRVICDSTEAELGHLQRRFSEGYLAHGRVTADDPEGAPVGAGHQPRALPGGQQERIAQLVRVAMGGRSADGT
jgi:hypothetical protein